MNEIVAAVAAAIVAVATRKLLEWVERRLTLAAARGARRDRDPNAAGVLRRLGSHRPRAQELVHRAGSSGPSCGPAACRDDRAKPRTNRCTRGVTRGRSPLVTFQRQVQTPRSTHDHTLKSAWGGIGGGEAPSQTTQVDPSRALGCPRRRSLVVSGWTVTSDGQL